MLKRDYGLDFLRGVAVTLVILHHYLQESSRTEYPVYLNYLVKFFIDHGAYGVQIFFVISGYILVTKYSTINSLPKFIFYRYSRLLPMLSLVILLNIAYSNFKEIKIVNLQSILSSLFIIDPGLMNTIFNSNSFYWIDDSFWSLFTEIRFYLIFGILFRISKNFSLSFKVHLLTYLYIFSQFINLFSYFYGFDLPHRICFWLFIPNYFIYFLLGVYIAVPGLWINYSKVVKLPFLGFLLILHVLTLNDPDYILNSPRVIVSISYVLLIFPIFSFQKRFVHKVNIFKLFAIYVGKSSYSSYLIHQNSFLFFIAFTDRDSAFIFKVLVFYIFTLALAQIVSKYLETDLIKFSRSFIKFK